MIVVSDPSVMSAMLTKEKYISDTELQFMSPISWTSVEPPWLSLAEYETPWSSVRKYIFQLEK